MSKRFPVSAREPEQLGLADCAAAQLVASEIYLAAVVVNPFDSMAEFAEPQVPAKCAINDRA
jgi:hypothetical protein